MSDLGVARGRLEVDYSQLAEARAAVQAFATGATTALTGINSSTATATQGLTGLASAARSFAGAFGISLGAAGIVQLGKMAVASDQLVVAYNRQRVAAEGLAGSQTKLNALLEVYGNATGGILDNATELANVTQLMSVGFADSTAELFKFATAIRGISIATGRTSDTITQNLILELFSQRGQRLDQLGLEYDKVRAKSDELQRADSSLTKEMAYQQAVLSEAQRKFGALADSSEGAISGLEALAKAWSNLRLELAQEMHPGLDEFFKETAAGLEWIQQHRANGGEAENLYRGMGLTVAPYGQAARDAGRHSGGSGGGASGIDPQLGDRQQAIYAWEAKRADIARQSIQDINDEETSFGRQRADTIANYNKDIARGAEDFARQRAQAEQNLQDSIADVQADGARRQVQMAQDLARTIANAQRDSADRLADLQENLDRTISERRADSADRVDEMEEDRDKSIAEKKADSAKRLIEIEQDYNEQRIRAEAQYHLDRTNAAMHLDARTLFELDAQHKLESEQALSAKDKQITDEKSKLDEAIQKVNDSYAERLADEAAALAKSIKQANDAHSRQVADEKEALQKRINNANEAYGIQLADGIAADNQRIQDLKDAFDKEKTQADTEYGLRLTRQKTDFDDQLRQQDDAHKLRITQIETHAGLERDALDAEFIKEMDALGLHNAAWLAAQKQQQEDALELFDTFWKAFAERFGATVGPVTKPDTGFLDPRRAQLQGTIDEWKRQRANTTDPAEMARLDKLIDDMQKAIDKLGPAAATVSGAAFNMPTASAFAPMPAMAAGAMMGGSNRSLAVTFAPGSIVINAVAGDQAKDLADMVDKRILHQIQVAAGRL